MKKIMKQISKDVTDEIPEGLVSLAAYLQSEIDDIPIASRDSAMVEFSCDDSALYIEINYSRPETDTERMNRKDADLHQVKISDEREILQFQSLAIKYGIPLEPGLITRMIEDKALGR